MLLFWRGTTRQGIIASVLVGMISSLCWILLSGETYSKVYGLAAENALVPFSQPGIVTIPLYSDRRWFRWQQKTLTTVAAKSHYISSI
jgi:Na+(H+)/acetate symporter ActP